MIDVGDETEVTKHKKKWELKADQDEEDIRFLLSHPPGKRFLWRLLEQCKIFETISHHDQHQMAILSGGRDKGLWVLDQINEADKGGFIKLIMEINKDD